MTPLARDLCNLYERMARDREAALDDLDAIFTPDIRFRDPFREVRGIEPFRRIFTRWLKQYPQIAFEGFVFQGNENVFALSYDMHLRMVVGPRFTVRITSVHQTRDGKVCDLLDSFDFSSALTSPVPLLGKLYRKTVNALFL